MPMFRFSQSSLPFACCPPHLASLPRLASFCASPVSQSQNDGCRPTGPAHGDAFRLVCLPAAGPKNPDLGSPWPLPVPRPRSPNDLPMTTPLVCGLAHWWAFSSVTSSAAPAWISSAYVRACACQAGGGGVEPATPHVLSYTTDWS